MSKKSKSEKLSEYSIFRPKTAHGLLDDYPDLKKKKAFKMLSVSELLFVWYYACEASPYYSTERKDIRVQLAYKASFEREDLKKTMRNAPSRSSYEAGQWSPKVDRAIVEMKKYKMGPRIRAMKINEKILTNCEHIINLDASDDKNFAGRDGEVDQAKKKAYVDAADKVMNMLPTLIKQMDTNFNVSEIEDEDDGSLQNDVGSLADQYHEKPEL